MKIYIIADIEGVSAVVRDEQVSGNSSHFEMACLQYTREVKAVCDAALSVGVEEIYVNDFHGNGLGIRPELLPREVLLIRGGLRPTSGFDFLDNTFSGLIILGAHARTGTHKGVLPHTYTGASSFEIFGQPVGEFDIFALLAGEVKVPTILISGDSTTVEHVATNFPTVPAVITKYGIGTNSALCIHPDLVCEHLRDYTKRAIKDIANIEPAQIAESVQLTIRLTDVCNALRIEWVPGMKRIDSTSFEYIAKSMREVASIMYGVSILVGD